jgi:hypothetical protein
LTSPHDFYIKKTSISGVFSHPPPISLLNRDKSKEI